MRRLTGNETGVTLIEVIVVAVVLAVLSAVSIPIYNGYIQDSRRNTSENVAVSAASFVESALTTTGSIGNVSFTGSSSGNLEPGSESDWLYSDEKTKSHLMFVTDAGDTSKFRIPSNIQIKIDDSDGRKVVVGAHVKSVIANTDSAAGGEPDSADITQPYYYH